MARKLLLADDSITIQKVIGITFANEDYELTVVDNGADAVNKAKEIKPDLILADVVMPEKDGYQVCQEIKSDPALSSIPVILLTGTFEPFDEAKSKEVGADDSITKPFESQTLIDKVRDHLEKAASAPVQAPAPEVQTAPEVAPPVPPAVEAPVPPFEEGIVDLGEEELWDMSEEVTAEEASAPAVESAAAQETAGEEEIWSDDEFADFGGVSEEIETEAEPVLETVAEPVAEAALEEETVSDEELWGGIDFNEEPAAPPAPEPAPEPAPAAPPVVEETSPTDEDEFADFGFEEEAVPVEEVAATAEAPEEAVEEAAPVSEEMFDFEEEVEALPQVEEPAPVEVPVEEAAPETTVAEPQVETVSSDVPVAAAVGTAQLSEAQMNELVSRVAKEIIEKVAWEVVPELAETLIKEEIKRLKGD